MSALGRNSWRNTQFEENENEFENSIPFPPSRTPLNTIPDPCQNPTEIQENESDSRGGRFGRLSDKKAENYATPRAGVRGKTHSEPSSAQSTPARSVTKVSNCGALGGSTSTRPPRDFAMRGGSSSRVHRGISIVPSEPSMEVPHFELVEDPSFWMGHNVQVLIRIRPISTTEKALQGYARCLRQDSAHTLTWVGHPETRFTFDHIACETTSQEKLFKVAGLPMVENCMSGYNSCMFAYGQTGSGKTYTMMGEIHEMDDKLNEDCGMTPRIFEYLFTRIRAEEENRRDEKLKYSCKCSFLEIYNEQITDLLEPSSTNLQLREDMRKGVYVENLTEYKVTTVKDVVELLLKGAMNRKIAATHMNSESSRSHSVFTCIIESRWEIDSMTHLRFGRLNLVDLAGSERQKSSGAEGERLKEAANINKSLSTLGLVIMTLVDVAHGKQRHVPYRDSRLTFLLQDSLGGNSKTTIIANISPSICSANETLSTLKFSQRAKLIQNNAKVNEDASGDVIALQRQIQQLKDQLTFLLKHQNVSRSLSVCLPNVEQSQSAEFHETYDTSSEGRTSYHQNDTSIPQKKMKGIKATLTGALRREKMAETAVRRLEARIEHMNRLVHEWEEDAQRTKMILRFREEKIKRLELLTDGLVSTDEYLMEENNSLSKEIHLLQERTDRNPELTRFALENIRLLEQLRMFQDFYEQGERETLLTEVSELRDQLMEILEGNYGQLKFVREENQEQNEDAIKELEDCRRNLGSCLEINMKLTREVEELRRELNKVLNCSSAAFDSVADSFSRDAEKIKQTDTQLSVLLSQAEILSNRTDSEDENASYNQVEDVVLQIKHDQKMGDASALQCVDTHKELKEARSLIEVMEYEQVRLIEELDLLQKKISQYGEVQSIKLEHNCDPSERYLKTEDPCPQDAGLMMEDKGEVRRLALQAKLDRMNRDLEDARILNKQYQDEQASELFRRNEVEQVCQQVEVETAKTILHLQEELATYEHELQEQLSLMTRENARLRNTIASREDEIRELAKEWEKAILELTSFLVDGCKSLDDASDQIESIANSFPEGKVWISEHVERAAKIFVEKEKTIVQLQKHLEHAHKMGLEMNLKFSSLKGATLAITEVQQLENDENTREVIQLQTLLSEKISKIQELECRLKEKEGQIIESEKLDATAAFIVEKRLSDFPSDAQRKVSEEEIPELAISVEQDKYRMPGTILNAQALEAIEFQVELARQIILESENAINASYADTERHLSALLSDILETSPVLLQWIQDLTKDISSMKKKFMESKEKNKEVQLHAVMPLLEACKSQKLENQVSAVLQIREELAEMNEKLKFLKTGIDALLNVNAYDFSVTVGDLAKSDTSSSIHLTSCSDLSAVAIAPKDFDESLPSTFGSGCAGKILEQKWDLIPERDSSIILDDQEFGMPMKPMENLICKNAIKLCLRKEAELAFNNLIEVKVRLAKLLDDKEMEDCSSPQGKCFHKSLAVGNHNHLGVHHKGPQLLTELEIGGQLHSVEQRMEEAESSCTNTREKLHLKLSDARLVADEKIEMASNFFIKFEETHATIKEADIMLNELLKANENAKYVTDRWKQAGEELMMERAGLIEEIQQLKSSICLKDEEYKSLQEKIHSGLVEVVNSVSSLEESFLQMQRDMEERFKLIYSDVFSLRKDLMDCICNSRSSLEDIWSDIMEKGFALFVLYQCHTGSFFKEISSLSSDPGFLPYKQKECYSVVDNAANVCISAREGSTVFKSKNGIEKEDQSECLQYKLSNPGDILDLKHSFGVFSKLEEEEMGLTHENLITENLSLKRALARKNDLLRGLLFDFSLLQESTSNAKDIKDETEQMFAALTKAQHELVVKEAQLDDILVQHGKLEAQLTHSEASLSISNSELEQAKETLDILSKQNTELRVLLEDLYVKKTDAEGQLEEKKEIVKGLEKEILRMACSAEEKILFSIEDIEDELRRAAGERDHLREVVATLNDKLEMANALADENEAIAVEARQESEASKSYAEQKEEEVKILEHSVEELERTINVLEKKVYEMGEEVERHSWIRDDLELELDAVRHRRLNVENVTEDMESEYSNVEQLKEDQTSRILELQELRKQIRILEKERVDQAKEIKECREYISELVLHAEAQASQYQQKYKTLEDMVREVKIDPSTSNYASSTLDKTERNSTRTRGSSSPFRCISNLVQQMTLEKDQELSVARLQIEELEVLASSRQKEVCMLNARLAAAESMTHDVIRDLLGVKLDMTNYANLIDQHHVQKLVEAAQQQTEESIAKEQEILNLRKQIGDLIEERQSCIEEINQREEEILAAQGTVDQLRQRDHMLTAQNEMLKMDKANLKRKIAEMDEMVKRHFGSQNIPRIQEPTKMKKNFSRTSNEELTKRLTHSEKLLSHVNDELSKYRKSDSRDP